MEKFANLAKIITILCASIITVCCLTYNYNTSPVSKDDSVKVFEVKQNSTYISIASDLKENNLIRSEFFYKLYIKINKPTGLQAGTYNLSEDMSVKEITELLSKGSNYNPDVIKITFPEGKQIKQIAEIIAEKTNHTQEEVIAQVSDKEYIKTLIDKYWFLTDDILNSKIYYPLEGYLFPDTYEFINKNVDIKTIIETMLNQMDKKLTPLKEEIEQNKYSIHQIVTLASMIQSEGNNVDDFKNMASVFLTRLDKGMKLQMCSSAYYGDKKIMGRDAFGTSYLKSNPYNTYVINGIPVGPISNPGIDAIEAVLKPNKNDYLYFASSKDMNIYYSKTLSEHESTIAKLKKAGNWYGS